MVVDAINPSIPEVEAGGLLCEASQVSRQYSETLSQIER